MPDVWRELDQARTETKSAQAVALLSEGNMKVWLCISMEMD